MPEVTPVSARVALLPGDGIGPEVVGAARAVVDAALGPLGARVDWDAIPCGGRYHLEHGRDWPEGADERVDAADAVLLGAVGWPRPDGEGPVTLPDGRMAGWSAVLGNRSRLDLYANVRPVRLLEGIRTRISGRLVSVWAPDRVDLVIFRENTEDLYYGAGGMLARGGVVELATDTRVVTRRGSERILRRAFEAARARRGKVTCVVKDNVLDGCRLFSRVFRELAETHPDVEAETMLVDTCAQALMTTPEAFDVVVTTNLFGDILTDLAAVLQGGMGMAVGANLGDARGMFEPVHGSAPSLAGTGRANPVAAILAGAEMLRWLGLRADLAPFAIAGERVEDAVRRVVRAGEALPPDLGGNASLDEVTDRVVEALETRSPPARP